MHVNTTTSDFPHPVLSTMQAMFYNFLSACTCYLGLVIGILLGELDMANQVLLDPSIWVIEFFS